MNGTAASEVTPFIPLQERDLIRVYLFRRNNVIARALFSHARNDIVVQRGEK